MSDNVRDENIIISKKEESAMMGIELVISNPNLAKIELEDISNYIRFYKARNNRMKNSYKRFTCVSVPIQKRKIGYTDPVSGTVISDPTKINRKLNLDYAGYIVRTKTNFMVSRPVDISIKKRAIAKNSEDQIEDLFDILEDFKIQNNWDTLLLETVESIGACGSGAWILSMQDGEVKIDNVMPWEIIEVEYGSKYLRHYAQIDFNGIEKEYVDIYDNEYVHKYKYEGETAIYIRSEKHLFSECPVLPIKNNAEKTSDFFSVESLIDQADRVMSDLSSEVEQFRLAYLVFTGGVAPKKEEVEAFQQTGVFAIAGENGDAKFITKEISIQDILKLLDSIERNIFRFAETFDSTNKEYMGDLTNFSIQFKLAPMKGKAIKTKGYLKQVLYKSFKLITSVWKLSKDKDINYLDLDFNFNFNEAINTSEEFSTIIESGGVISNETLWESSSAINPIEERRRLEQESKNSIAVEEVYGNGEES